MPRLLAGDAPTSAKSQQQETARDFDPSGKDISRMGDSVLAERRVAD